MGVFSVGKFSYVFSLIFHNYVSCGVVGICAVVYSSTLIVCFLSNNFGVISSVEFVILLFL